MIARADRSPLQDSGDEERANMGFRPDVELASGRTKPDAIPA